MTISPVGFSSLIYRIDQQTAEYNKLSTELSTGLVGSSYSDLGTQRATALGVQSQLTVFDAYSQTSTIVNTRLQVLQTTLTSFTTIAANQRSDNANNPFAAVQNGQSIQQVSANQRLSQVIDMLNQDVAGRKLFSGRNTSQDASLSASDIINGTGAQAGLRQVINERNRADSGSDGLGRLAISNSGNVTASFVENVPTNGYTLSPATAGGFTNATVTNIPASGSNPHSIAVAFTGQPVAGESLTFTVNLPDGSTKPVTLTATSGAPSAGQFQIGADVPTTAANFTTALSSAIQNAVGANKFTTAESGNVTNTLSETASGPFGYKIASDSGNLTNATLTDVPATSTTPHSVKVAFTGQPNVGESVNLVFTLPDGTKSNLTLSATTGTPGPGQFQIGSDVPTTAANFSAALTSTIKTLTVSDLVPASTAAAADGFFNVSANQAPQRVNITTTPEQATSLRNGTPADTVVWYTGDNATDDPRATATARVDSSTVVAYGVRATEPAIRSLVANLATFAAVQFDPTNPNVQSAYQNLAAKVRARLADTTQQTIQGLSTTLAGVQTTIKDTTDRQTATKGVLQNVLASIENVDTNKVAVELSALQTQIQASYQTTAQISKLSLVNFI